MSTEEQIRSLLARGDHRGGATLAIRAYHAEVLRLLRASLRNEADAQEAFSVFAEHLWRSIGSYEGRASFRTWALRIAANAALNLRSEAWRRRGRGFEPGEASALAARLSTASAVRLDAQRSAVDRLRESLSFEDQLLLALRIDQALSWADVAEVLSTDGAEPVSAATLMKRFERLKERLTRLASDAGLLDGQS
jgi:RNA polymerase sigma-70 factor, ECF subfamily